MRPPCVTTKAEWPPDYRAVFEWRQQQVRLLRDNPTLLAGALAYYETRPVEFITHWLDTYDPRNAITGLPIALPFVLFPRQADLVEFYLALLEGEGGGLIEKSRDMGATWLSGAFSVWAWRFVPGSSIGWGSRKETLVDKLGDPDSIFEKIRMMIRGMPPFFLPRGFSADEHLHYMRVINPENGATITGEAGDNIGRGGRKTMYFKDESAHYERPELIEAALADNTRCQVDISSVNGLGNVFHRRRETGVVWEPGAPIDKVKANVFIMDWSDHPMKDQAWYDQRKAQAEAAGLLHVFAQEVDRDYASSVDNVVIPAKWVDASIDAHKKLGFGKGGIPMGALDVADEGGDKNAIAIRRGPLVTLVKDWAKGDTGQTTRTAIQIIDGMKMRFMYDCIGVGAGVKAEANRLDKAGKLKGIKFVAWNAAAAPNNKDEPIDPNDDDSPTPGQLYSNLKAQAWWELRKRFERTYQAVEQGATFEAGELISLPSDLENLAALRKELSQALSQVSSTTLKLKIDKKGKGMASPNLADALVMCFWPVANDTYTLENIR
jgi:hypothetical protein